MFEMLNFGCGPAKFSPESCRPGEILPTTIDYSYYLVNYLQHLVRGISRQLYLDPWHS